LDEEGTQCYRMGHHSSIIHAFQLFHMRQGHKS
jgi:hypothetical protein